MDFIFILLGAGLWGLMALLAKGLHKLEPRKGERP